VLTGAVASALVAAPLKVDAVRALLDLQRRASVALITEGNFDVKVVVNLALVGTHAAVRVLQRSKGAKLGGQLSLTLLDIFFVHVDVAEPQHIVNLMSGIYW